MKAPSRKPILEAVTPARGGQGVVYGLAVFVGAFLLFAVQPLVGKFILPWFGGGGEIWTTCMLFFQVLLLAGYAYAHLIVTRLRSRLQAAVHVLLLAAALAALHVVPSPGWRHWNLGSPTVTILAILALAIGLPYFVLSATGPLLQGWFARTSGGASPYRLYALSNAGSLLALVSFPFVFEPAFSRQTMGRLWSWGLAAFAALCGYCAVLLWRSPTAGGPARGDAAGKGADAASAPSIGTRLLWLALPAAASVELLAVTNKICQDVAAVPFLWVLPLCLYLLSFVICFHDRRWYVRPVFLSGFMLSMMGAVLAAIYQQHLSAVAQIAIFCTMLFLCCMVCHGEVYRLRPQPRYLTGYYLMIALGGAVGGVFVAVIAPLIFRAYLELNLGMMACCLFVLLADKTPALRRGRRRWVYVSVIILVGVLVALVPTSPFYTGWTVLTRHRNFYGVATVWERSAGDPLRHCRLLEHGTTVHGIQLVDPAVRRAPTAYYGVKSGVGVALLQLLQGGGRRIGVVGLGVGTIAAYGRPGDTVRFYEINPAIERLARSLFGYLADSLANTDVVMGDARLSLEGEPPQEFDMLVLDAFSSDSVPVHLLTKEAFGLYLRHLRADGVIAVHASARHVDLESVAFTLADHFKLHAALIEDAGEESEGTLGSSWVLLSRNEALMNSNAIRAAAGASQANYPRTNLWTDDRANLLRILR